MNVSTSLFVTSEQLYSRLCQLSRLVPNVTKPELAFTTVHLLISLGWVAVHWWVFCDLSNAFDCVNHAVLIHKLKGLCFNGQTIKLLQSYLKEIENREWNYSLWANNYGVPQGAILGPLVILTYINNVPSHFQGKYIRFYSLHWWYNSSL